MDIFTLQWISILYIEGVRVTHVISLIHQYHTLRGGYNDLGRNTSQRAKQWIEELLNIMQMTRSDSSTECC